MPIGPDEQCRMVIRHTWNNVEFVAEIAKCITWVTLVVPPFARKSCSKNNMSMNNVFTLTNINTKIIKGKLIKNVISEVVYQTSSPSH